MKKYYRYIGLFVALSMIIGGLVYWYQKEQETKRELKREILKRDKLLLIKDDQIKIYQKMVDDTRTVKEMIEFLKEYNKVLHDELKRLKEKPAQIIRVVSEIPGKRDTVEIKDTIIQEKPFKSIVSYYPNVEKWFVNHEINFYDGVAYSEWDFNDLEIDIVVSETKSGIFKSYLFGPSWLKLRELDVKTIPYKRMEFNVPKFSWIGGGGTGFGFDKEIYFMASFGVMVEKNIGLISINTDKDIELQYLRSF